MGETSVPEEKPAYAFPVFDKDSPVRQISVASELYRCLFCKRSEIDELHFGPLYSLPEEKVTVHYYCMLFSAGLEQHGDDREGILGFMPEDIFKEVRRASRLKCLYCGISGASIGCNRSRCKASFHYPCGLANDANFQFVKNYQSYCKNHRECADFIVPDDHTCPICYNPIENQRPVCGSCCKTAIFHKDCIQKQALSSGYFFKCPTCNSLENFHYETKVQGIYVPEQDASWEREPDAFQELYQQYEHCDAEICECPKGRNYGANKGAWLLARCRVCGSAGTHRQCGKLTTIANWACTSCLDFEARCAAKKMMEENIVKAPKVLVVTTSVPSKPTENGVPSPPTIVEKRKRIRTGRKPPKQIQKKPEVKAPPPPAKTTRLKKEKPLEAAPAPEVKKVTEVKKSRKRKTDNIIQKRTYKRRKRNDLTPEDIDWLDTEEEEANVDLSKVHIGSACGDFFPYTKKVKKEFAMKGFDCFPDWRGYSLQVQVVNIFLDLVDPVLPQESIQKTEVKVQKPVSTDTASKKNTTKSNKSKVTNSLLVDSTTKKTESKVVDSVSTNTAPKRSGRKVVNEVPTETTPKKNGRKVVQTAPINITTRRNSRNLPKPVLTDVTSKKNEKKENLVPKSPMVTENPEKPIENLPGGNITKNTSNSPKKRGRRKRTGNWRRGVVKKKKSTSAKAKVPAKSKDSSNLDSLKPEEKKSEKDKPASASKAILEGIRRSHESLLQFQQGKSTSKSTDEKGELSDTKPEQNGGTPRVDEVCNEKGSRRRRPSPRGAVSEVGSEGKANENRDKDTSKNGSSICKSENSTKNDRSFVSTTSTISSTNNQKTVESSTSSSSSDGRLPQSNGTSQSRTPGIKAFDKPVIKVEVDDTNNRRDSDHDDGVMDTSDTTNRRANLAEELQNSARGIARHLLQLSNRNEAHEKLRLLEQRCPQLFQRNVKK